MTREFYLCSDDDCGNLIYRRAFDGSEYIKTTCPECEREARLDFKDFARHVTEDFDFNSTKILCCECSAKKGR